MRVLVGCEESQEVCKAFREKGHEAYSCDVQECSGGYPEWHIQDDIHYHLNKSWDMLIGFPPCTHVANAGGRWFPEKRKDGRQEAAIRFFLTLMNAPIHRIALENPVGILSGETYINKHFPNMKYELEKVNMPRKPEQVIQPFYFGHDVRKYTCLWLKNLNPLVWVREDDMFNKSQFVTPQQPVNTVIRKGIYRKGTERKLYWYDYITGKDAGKIKSKTFPGIARAMADQWG